MINIITKRLKLNVTNIRSSLIFNRKKIKKINSEKNKFVLIKKNQEDITKKESKIESSDRISVIQNIGKKLLSGPLSLIDKFKEFFGLILLGIAVNNLPTIVQKLQDVFEKIKTFFNQNPWIGNTIKFAFDIIGKGIMGLAKFIKFVRPYIGGSFKFALDTIRSTKNQIGSLIETFDELNLSFGGLIKDLDVDKIPDVSKEPEKYSAFIAGGGKSSVNEKGQSVDEVVEQGRKNISKYDTKPIQPTQTKPPVQPQPPGSNPPVQKLARGGTVGSIPPSEGTGRGGPSDVAKTAPYLLKPSLPRTPFARPGGTAIGKRTIRTINYFEKFKENVSNSEETSKQNEKNNNSFFNILKKLNEIKNLRLKVKDDEGGRDGGAGGAGGGGEGGGDFIGTAADIPPEGKALLDAIAGAEAPGYNSRYPSKTFSGYKDHPRIPEPTPDGRTSDAAGRYQFISSTWDSYKPAKAFTPENQDIAAWRLATATYGYGESGIVKDLQKDPMKVADKLKGQWPSLPGGSQPNNATSGFLSRYKAALKRYKELTTKPTAGAFRNVLPQGNPQFSSGFQTKDRPGHNGIDIGVDVNAPVVALQSGKVVDFYNSFGGVGNAVVVQHSDKTKLIYGHVVASGGLKVGDPVQKGQVIAKVVYYRGPSGEDYTHLHLERVVGGRWVNPIPFLNSVENSRVEELKRNDPRRKIEPGKLGPVLPTTTTQSIMAPTPSVPFGKVLVFTARNGKRYRVEFGKFFEGQWGIIPVNTNDTKNKWLIDDYNKSVERYQINQQSNEKPSPNSGEEGSNAASLISPKSKNSEIASLGSGFGKLKDVVIVNRTQPIIVENVQTIAYGIPVEIDSDSSRLNTSSRITSYKDILGA
jgi:murein DD-endopeptidase MepM/ murein hydrolase activator NlpD